MSTDQPARYPSTEAVITAEAPDVPSFLFSHNEVAKSAAAFRDGIDALLTYAVKANPATFLLEALHQNGVKAFDVASTNEMEVLTSVIPDAVMHYNNPIRTRREIETAYHQYGVRSYVVDHADELKQLAETIPASKDVEITIRFKAGRTRRAYDFGTKFGILEAGAIELAAEAKRLGFSVGLCFHVGSQCEEDYAYVRHIACASRIAKAAKLDLTRLNVGGGFPARYPSSAAPPLSRYFESITGAVKSNFGDSKPPLIMEPGRRLAASSTSVLLRVKHQRNGMSIYLNDGVYGALMEVKFMPILPPVRVWRDGKVVQGEVSAFTVFGPTCDSYDSLPRPFPLPEIIREDDWVEFGQMGAYSQASTTSFNGFATRDTYFVDEILV